MVNDLEKINEPLRVLVCGGRDYQDGVGCLSLLNIGILIHGDARGADRKAAEWAKANGIHAVAVPALWDLYGKRAGPLRNAAMLKLNPNYCVAFPGGAGTRDMIKRCEAAGLPVWQPFR